MGLAQAKLPNGRLEHPSTHLHAEALVADSLAAKPKLTGKDFKQFAVLVHNHGEIMSLYVDQKEHALESWSGLLF